MFSALPYGIVNTRSCEVAESSVPAVEVALDNGVTLHSAVESHLARMPLADKRKQRR